MGPSRLQPVGPIFCLATAFPEKCAKLVVPRVMAGVQQHGSAELYLDVYL